MRAPWDRQFWWLVDRSVLCKAQTAREGCAKASAASWLSGLLVETAQACVRRCSMQHLFAAWPVGGTEKRLGVGAAHLDLAGSRSTRAHLGGIRARGEEERALFFGRARWRFIRDFPPRRAHTGVARDVNG